MGSRFETHSRGHRHAVDDRRHRRAVHPHGGGRHRSVGGGRRLPRPRTYERRWFERAIGDFGQSSGTVASGFLLNKMADPDNTSGASASYGYKRLFLEPFLGGGLITALSLPLIDAIGGFAALIASVVMVLLCLSLARRIHVRAVA